jgi:hypothetical protein
MTNRSIVRFGGWCLAAGAVAFMVVFSYLAANFNYPDVLDGSADTVLPALLATGTTGRAVWAIYAFLPLIWLPAGVAAFEALESNGRAAMRFALGWAIVAAIAMMLGLMRWPSMQWALAQEYVVAAPPAKSVIAATFAGLNSYLGNYIGEFLGELAVSAFFLLTALVWLRTPGRKRWIGWMGVVTAVLGFIGMFRNVSTTVGPVSDVNNYLLPVYMIVLGLALGLTVDAPSSAGGAGDAIQR